MGGTKTDLREFPPVPFDEFAVPAREEWYKEAEAALKGAPFEKRMYSQTYEGITLEPIYDLEGSRDLLKPGGLPGEPPFLRGTETSGYLGRPWGIAQSSSDVLPQEANRAARRELEKGATVLRLELDECTKMGLDPSPEYFKGDYRGLSLSTLRDAEETFRGFSLDATPLHIYAGASAAPLLGLIAAMERPKEDGSALLKLSGCIGADPLGELAERGRLALPAEELYDEMAQAIEWAELNAPGIKTILARGEPYHNGGASAVQETACAVSAAIAYVRAMRRRGIEPERSMKQIRFSFSIGANFFMEIARLRAARMIWAQIAEAFGLPLGECGKQDVIAGTSAFTNTLYDPYVNILRETTQAFSAAVGGAGCMTVGGFDEAARPCGELAKRVARNIQIMLQSEFDALQPADPAGGSWYVERLTAQCAAKIWEMLQEIDSEGGLYAALKNGSVQKSIDCVFQKRLKNLAFRKDRAVGTNMYPNTREEPLAGSGPKGEDLYKARRAAVDAFTAGTDRESVDRSLANIQRSFGSGGGAFVDAIASAFSSGATMGRVREALNDGFTGDERAEAIGRHRWTEEMEGLRRKTEDFTARTGRSIRIFLATMGPVPQHKARADFSAGFMEVAHFEVIRGKGFDSPEEAALAAAESGADAAVICSTDETYPELVPPVARDIKRLAPEMKVLLAGAPAPEYKNAYDEAGVDDYIHVRANCYEILKTIQESVIDESRTGRGVR